MSNRIIGGSDMAQAVRSLEWCGTPLGSVDNWPSSLSMCLNLILASRFPSAILWGSELILLYNDAYRIIAADKHPHALGRSTKEIWSEVWHINKPIFEAVMNRGETIYLENQHFSINRSGHHLEEACFTLSYSPIYLETGVVGGCLVTLIETTDQRKREKDGQRIRALVEKELADSKAILESVVENAPVMIFVKDAMDLRFILFNRAGEDLLGHDRRALLGKNDWDFFTPAQAAHFIAKDREVLDGGAAILDIPEEPIMTAHKGERLLHTRKACIRGSDGKPRFLLGISEDITERKNAEKEKNELQTQLFYAEKLAAIGTLVAGIAHEISNPLAIVRGYSHILGKKLKEIDPENHDMTATTINNAIDRIVIIINGLRTYVSADTVHMEVLDINKVIFETISLVQETLKETGIEIRHNLAKDLPHVRCNVGKIQQVLINLLNNAIDALKQLPEGRRISIETLVKEEDVIILLSDNGPGVPEDILGKIMDPFFTTKEVGKGTGLGLSVSSAIIESLGGTFKVSSKVGEGATFHITLPCVQVFGDTF